LEKALAEMRTRYNTAAAALSRKRRAATKKLESSIERELKSLAMPNAKFVVHWDDVTPGRGSGIDRLN